MTAMAERGRVAGDGAFGGGVAGGWEAGLSGRLIAGDETALVEVYEQFSSFVFGLARRVTASTTLAEDITQEVFSHLWEKPHAFDPGRGTLRAWLGVLTHRRSVDRVRRETTARRHEQRQAVLVPAPAPPDIAEAATSLIVAQHVRDAVAALPDEQRQAVELAYFRGKTYVQVAEELGIPEGTAKSRLRLAMRKLAAVLGPEGIHQCR
jgi:RNA polymerase sigma-70 factor (ECF subfamily)